MRRRQIRTKLFLKHASFSKNFRTTYSFLTVVPPRNRLYLWMQPNMLSTSISQASKSRIRSTDSFIRCSQTKEQVYVMPEQTGSRTHLDLLSAPSSADLFTPPLSSLSSARVVTSEFLQLSNTTDTSSPSSVMSSIVASQYLKEN